MKQTATNSKSKQLFIKKNIVAKFNNLTQKSVQDNLMINDTFPTTVTSIVKTAVNQVN
jgi:hypothetical protein